MMGWYGSGMGGWGFVLMSVSTVLFWGLVVFGIVALIRYTGRGAQAGTAVRPPSAPNQVLAERFARGEIDEDEYRQRLRVLGG